MLLPIPWFYMKKKSEHFEKVTASKVCVNSHDNV